MKASRMIRIAVAAAALVAAVGIAQAQQAQNGYPSKPVRIIVGFSAGGTPDMLARLIGPKMTETWGQPVVVENRTGAGGTLAAVAVAKAARDGYTLLLTSPSFVFNAAMRTDLPYDSVRDFAGVAGFGNSVTLLVVAPSLGVKSVKEFIALAKAQPGKLLASSPGVGSAIHFNVERFRLMAGITVGHVPYKGQPESLVDIAADRVHFTLAGAGVALPLIQTGKLQVLGVTNRSPLLPDAPLISDTLPGWSGMGTQCLLAPAGTPRPVIERINAEVSRILKLPDVKARLQSLDFIIEYSGPDELDRRLRADMEIAHKLVRDAGLTAQ